jgi:hypothetical protein
MLERYDGKHYTGYHYANDIEIAKVSFLRSESYRSFFDFVDCSGGIFVHRWGCPIRSMAVWALLPKSKVPGLNFGPQAAQVTAMPRLPTKRGHVGAAPRADRFIRTPEVS